MSGNSHWPLRDDTLSSANQKALRAAPSLKRENGKWQKEFTTVKYVWIYLSVPISLPHSCRKKNSLIEAPWTCYSTVLVSYTLPHQLKIKKITEYLMIRSFRGTGSIDFCVAFLLLYWSVLQNVEPVCVNALIVRSLQWRIQEFSRRKAPTPKRGSRNQFF